MANWLIITELLRGFRLSFGFSVEGFTTMYRGLVHSLKRSLSIVPKNDRRNVYFICIFQFFLATFDLIGVFLIGSLSIILISGSKPQGALKSVNFFSESLSNYGLTNSQIVLALGISASAIFILKTTISIYTTRRILHYLNNIGSRLSTTTMEKTLGLPYLAINKLSIQEIIFNTTRGIELLISNVLAPATILIADLATVILLVLGLISVNVFAAISSFIFFGGIALLLYKSTHTKINSLGTLNTELTIESNEIINEIFLNYKENLVAKRFEIYVKSLKKLRKGLANVLSEVSFVQYLAKYIFELTLAILLSILAISYYLFSSKSYVLPIIAIFLASAMRLAPSILRVQQGVTQIHGSFAMAETAITYIEKLNKTSGLIDEPQDIPQPNLTALQIEFKSVNYRYPETQIPVIKSVSFQVEPGQRLAIVGSSGSGKTTLTDLLLGILEPDVGAITLNGISPRDFVAQNKGVIGYVPQDIVLTSKSILENVCIGYDIDSEKFNKVVKMTGLSELIDQLPKRENTILDPRLTNLSGGQKQRIGLARALFSNPKLIVLDEATSALDRDAEGQITEVLNKLKPSVTVVLITHSMNSVVGADSVMYMESGVIKSFGSLDLVRSEIPEFNSQFLSFQK